MIAVSNVNDQMLHTGEVVGNHRSSLISLDLDETATAQILGIARRHCKLALSMAKSTRLQSGGGKSLGRFRVCGRCVKL